ncbi:hypothetical protein AB4142_32850, partial [Variovorax sp. 2RAF20]
MRTVARKGYRFVGQVKVGGIGGAQQPDQPAIDEHAHTDPKETPSSSLVLPDKPSITVLPFQNLSGDPEQEYFADGVVEDIIA